MINPDDIIPISEAILQIDGTVLAGILILLTIRSFVSEAQSQKFKDVIKPSWVVSFVGTPFAVSAIMALVTLTESSSKNSESHV